MAPSSIPTLFFCLVGVALLCAPLAAYAQEECFNGMVCCKDCNEKCAGNTIACKQDCISPCITGQICEGVGESVADGSASAACQAAKEFCKIPLPKGYHISTASVDLATCCRVVIGSCQGVAEKIPCKVEDGNYGECTEFNFNTKYLELVSQECKDTVCLDNACKDELANDPNCT